MTRRAQAALAAAVLVASCVDVHMLEHVGPVEQQHARVLIPAWHRALVLMTDRTYNPYEGSSPEADPTAGLVYVGTSMGRFYGLRSSDGARVWSFDAKEAIHSTPVLSDDRSTVYFGNEAGTLFALESATGKELWRYDARAEIRSRPLLHEQILLLKDARGKVHAVDGEKGTGLWLYRGELPEGFLVGSSAGVGLASGRVLAGFSDGTAVGLKLVDGSVSWEADLGEYLPGDDPYGGEKTDLGTTPVVVDAHSAIFSSFKGGVFALDPTTGAILWRRSDLKRASGLSTAGGRIYVAIASKGVTALDLEGDTVWKSNFSSGTITDPVPVEGRIFVTDSKFGLVVLSRTTGQVLDRFTPAWGASGRALVRSGRAFFVSNGGHIWSFMLREPAG
jgi:outer membrane protein assembly factor BamB